MATIQLSDLLSQDEIEVRAALDILKKELDGGKQDTLLLLSARWHRNEKANRQGTLDARDYKLERNKIMQVLLDFSKGVMVEHESVSTPEVSDRSDESFQHRKIYFSYSWKDSNSEGDEIQQMINRLFESLQDDGFAPVRDQEDLPYGGSIEQFMRDVGSAPLIVVFTSPRYFHSPYCMYELSEIGRTATWDREIFRSRILPVVLEHVDFSRPATLGEYIKHWKRQEQEWRDFFEDNDSGDFPEQHRLYVRLREMNRNMGKLGAWINDINASNLRLLSEDDFALIKGTISQRLRGMAQ